MFIVISGGHTVDMSLPRLTGAVRAFGPVSSEGPESDASNDDLLMKRQQRAKRESEQGLTWSFLARTIKRKSGDAVTEKLRQLTHIAREMGKLNFVYCLNLP